MYRILGQHGEVREPRQQLRPPAYQKPELLAEKSNEVGPGTSPN
jgi:putative transposase